MKKYIRNLIVGEHNYIESWVEYRRVILSGQFALLAILVCLLYIVLDSSWAVYETTPVYLASIAVCGFTLALHRHGHHSLANLILFPTLNFILFLFAASEGQQTGAYILFIPVSIGAFAVFNYQQRFYAVGMACLSFLFFLMAYLGDVSLLPRRLYTQDELAANFIINFAVALPVSILTIYLLIRLNHRNSIELVKSNKLLTKSNEELDRFVYSTSHDLRAPLTSIKGLIHLIGKTDNPAEAAAYLKMMDERVDSLDAFIKSITDYSRNNRLQVSCEKINVHELAREVWGDLEFCPEARAIEFRNELPENLMIENDRGRLRIVVQNLISNAIRYHDHRKDYKYIRLYHRATQTSFSIHLEDNGQGIAPDVQKRVFDMFYRGNESSQGSGLGLYIVKETITKLAGTIQLFSQPREGSTFVVTFPAKGFD